MLVNEKALEELRLWLLGLLPEQESRSFEERLITDSEKVLGLSLSMPGAPLREIDGRWERQLRIESTRHK